MAASMLCSTMELAPALGSSTTRSRTTLRKAAMRRRWTAPTSLDPHATPWTASSRMLCSRASLLVTGSSSLTLGPTAWRAPATSTAFRVPTPTFFTSCLSPTLTRTNQSSSCIRARWRRSRALLLRRPLPDSCHFSALRLSASLVVNCIFRRQRCHETHTNTAPLALVLKVAHVPSLLSLPDLDPCHCSCEPHHKARQTSDRRCGCQ
mmetsp:Transcript_11565/g.32763  ORF Transcript_11565/g.32763 Transcript_11565/m.32763 type:complete len:207 (-) Transcript_11565:142-762(-)